MNIEHKLKLSQNPVVLIREGGFLRFYNQSFYIVSERLGLKLKPIIKPIKKINQIVVYSGFPLEAITKYFPDATLTDYGYQLSGKFDLADYQNWYQLCCKQVLSGMPPFTIKPDEPMQQQLITDLSQYSLTYPQLQFLNSWQEERYPRSVDSAFIRELKNYFNV